MAKDESIPVVSDEETRRKDKEGWSSLPPLLLWMVKDKLDIFDNKCLEAVCRDWQSASERYPKVLQSVGDGLPWIVSSSFEHDRLEFISVTRGRKFEFDVPGYVYDAELFPWVGSVLFSKQGWILLHVDTDGYKGEQDLLLLVNPFTKAKITLPHRNVREEGGCFTTNNDGYPQRVFLQENYGVITASPGDKKWTHVTGHTYLDLPTVPLFYSFNDFITIGDYVYSLYGNFWILAWNLSDQTRKEIPPPTNTVGPFKFIVEDEGELLLVNPVADPDENSPYMFSSFALHKYDIAASSWKMISVRDVKDTTWFYHTTEGSCIPTKGQGGLKIYLLRQERKSDIICLGYHTSVELYDLLIGRRKILPVPFNVSYSVQWADIG